MSATINYCTLKLPAVLFENTKVINSTPSFEVRSYNLQKGVFFRIPHGAKEGDVYHAFMEHEINLNNTLRTGTLTMKIQITLVPCHMGVFSGFEHLDGTYQADFNDDFFGDVFFKPNYQSDNNVKNIVPLPPNMHTNLYEFLNEILFKQVDDVDIISKYALALGCQRKTIKASLIPMPVQTSDSAKGVVKFHQTVDFFNSITSGNGTNLLPEKNS